MTTLRFRDAGGSPLVGVTVVVTAAPGEITEIGYLTSADGTLKLTVPEPGEYFFTITATDGRPRNASAYLTRSGEIDVTAR